MCEISREYTIDSIQQLFNDGSSFFSAAPEGRAAPPVTAHQNQELM
jgi:hypothetical protein